MTSYAEAVASWEAHLREGGTTTWSAWRVRGETTAGAPQDGPTPDAPHLELLRRLNALPGGTARGLQDLVLDTASPGRGLVDPPLPWPDEPRRFGTPAVEPDLLPVEELVRLAVGVLARLVPGLPPAPHAERSPRWPFPWRRRVRLHGSPSTAAAVRGMLLDQGVVETDWRPVHLVVARPVEVMMAEHWAAAARAGGILKWSTLWRRAVAADRLPAPIDVARVAERLEGRPHEPVHVLVAHDVQHVAALAADVLGAHEVALDQGGRLAQTDLLRRLNRLLALTAGPGDVRDLTARLLAHGLDDTAAGGPPQAPFVPAPARPWAEEVATRTADRLSAAGYAVRGDLTSLAPLGPPAAAGDTVDHVRTLDLALAACVRSWQAQRDGQEGP